MLFLILLNSKMFQNYGIGPCYHNDNNWSVNNMSALNDNCCSF